MANNSLFVIVGDQNIQAGVGFDTATTATSPTPAWWRPRVAAVLEDRSMVNCAYRTRSGLDSELVAEDFSPA
jgi:hypothetical protein